MVARVVTVAFDGVEARRVDVEVQQVATPAGAFAPPAPRFESTTRFVQFPGMTLSEGMQDAEVVS